MLALVAATVGILLVRSDDSGTTESAGGEIFLEPADEVGPDPFGEDLVGTALSAELASTPVSTAGTSSSTSADPTAPVATQSISGGERGLYGGSLNVAVCDPDQQALWLEQHPDVAAAFVQALNGDPTLRWSGGSQVQVSEIRAFLEELTPVTLTGDTRVTNHGYANGAPTARQAILQAGTAVMVDAYGVPRVKCNCGNPLTAPTPVQVAPVYTGPQWPTFSPTTVVVVTEVTVLIDVFVLSDLDGGGWIERPAGTAGDEDVFVPEDGDTTTTTSTRRTTTSTSRSTTTTTGRTGGNQTEFCTRFEELLIQYSDIDPSVPELVAIWQELTDLAPPEVAPAMETLNEAIKDSAAVGSDSIDGDDPALTGALTQVLVFLQGPCGIPEDLLDG